MRRWILLAALVMGLLVSGCPNDVVENEDWDEFTDIYKGAGPLEEGAKLYFKIEFNGDDVYAELEGPFFAELQGEVVEARSNSRKIVLTSLFRSNECLELTRVDFEGQVREETIEGRLVYDGCKLYEFYYEGVRVGGIGSGL